MIHDAAETSESEVKASRVSSIMWSRTRDSAYLSINSEASEFPTQTKKQKNRTEK